MSWLGLCWRGVLMGIVEALPGISGGTVALITNIYDEMVDALGQWARLRASPASFESRLNAAKFLVQLGLWMGCGFLIALFTVTEFVDNEPRLFWGTVFGVVLGVVIELGRTLKIRHLARFTPLGLLLGLPIVALPEWTLEPPLWLYAMGGVGAFSAWILPGISGAMVLLLMGLWLPMLEAIRALEIAKIALFVSGMALAFAVLPKLISHGLQKHRQVMVAFFVGLVVSTTYRVWPWQSDQGVPHLPGINDESQFFATLACSTVGLLVVLTLMRVAERRAV